MTIVDKKLTELKPYEKNPRHNKEAIKGVANSIKEFGFKVPIVIDKNNVIVAGHTRYQASLELGLETVPCIIADDLTPKQIKAFRLADNKTAEKSYWDFDLLNQELADIGVDIDMTLFDFRPPVDVLDDEDESDDFEDDEEDDDSDADDADDGQPSFRITYEIVFNTEEEQSRWYSFLSAIKKEYPEVETISERILKAVEEWKDGKEGA